MPSQRRNNFDALRLAAALMVIVGHGRDMEGFFPPFVANTQMSAFGLDIFFAISGYLVTDSWLRGPRLGPFLARRTLRILPGLAAAVAVTAFGIGAAATTLPLGRYLVARGTLHYLLNVGLYLELYLPGVFRDRRLGGAVNGSLWSLFPEFVCYGTVPLFACLRVAWRPVALAAATLAVGLFAQHLFTVGWGYLFYSLDLKYGLAQVPFFLAGALLQVAERRWSGLLGTDGMLACVVLSYGWTFLPAPWNLVLQWFTLPFLVIYLGRRSTPVLRDAARFGDLSYGLYLYAFPVQQLILERATPLPIAECMLATAVLAFASWHLVERPALRFKPRADRARPVAGAGASTVGSSASVIGG